MYFLVSSPDAIMATIICYFKFPVTTSCLCIAAAMLLSNYRSAYKRTASLKGKYGGHLN